MVINVNAIRVPPLARLLGKRFQLDFPGYLVSDLVHFLARLHGPQVQQIFLDERGEIEDCIMIVINDEGILPISQCEKRQLKDGDSVQFMLLLGGG